MTTDELREIPLFSRLSDTALERILGSSAVIDAAPGQVLTRSDDAASGMFVLLDGRVAVELGETVHELKPPNFFGELSLLVPDSKRVARVRAAEPTRCLTLPRAEFLDLLENEPGLALPLLREIARRLLELES